MMRPASQHTYRACVLGAGAAAVATAVRASLPPGVLNEAMLFPAVMAVVFASWYGGAIPGLVTTLVATLTSDWFLFAPIDSLLVASNSDQRKIAVFIVLGCVISVASESLQTVLKKSRRMETLLSEREVMGDNLRQLAADLSEAGRRKDQFLATLSHELRNPLAPMRSALQVMKLARAPEEVESARAMVERQVVQMVRLVDDLMDVSRITRDQLDLRLKLVTLRSVIDISVENTRPFVEWQAHRLEVSVPDEAVYLYVDPTRIAQVLSNLLNNAAKYTDRGGLIRVWARLEGSQAVISVIDNGIGVSPEMIPRVMEMFGQVDHSLERSGGGLGIGLSLAKRLVEMHGGQIALRAATEGPGTEVEVRLPITDAPKEEERVPEPLDSLATMARRILVADDNQDSVAALGMLLQLYGHEVHIAHDGIEAVDMAEQFRPDFILLDIGMPKLNGYEACRQIRALPWARSVAIVAVTGWGQDEDRERTRAAGFDLHVVKPLEPSMIARILTELAPQD